MKYSVPIFVSFIVFFGVFTSPTTGFPQKSDQEAASSKCDNSQAAPSVDSALLTQSTLLHEKVAPISLADLPVDCVENIVNANSPENSAEKTKIIFDTADSLDMPPTVLLGAMMQETHLGELSLSNDFGNWACGIGQINVNDWCNWANKVSAAEQSRINWPTDKMRKFQNKNRDIDLCDTDFLRPDHAMPFLGKLNQDGQAQIQDSDIRKEFDMVTAKHRREKGDDALERTSNEAEAENLRFDLTRNFVEHCSDARNGIPALAKRLKTIFDSFPKKLRESQHISNIQDRKSNCSRIGKSKALPLQIGWLLADAVYNAGEEILPGVYAYQKKTHLGWDQFGPQDLIDAINYALTLENSGISAIGAKEAKIHIRGVVRNVTAPGETIVK